MKNIMEIGPGFMPAKDFIANQKPSNVIFVDERKPQFEVGKLFPNAKYFEGSFLDLVSSGVLELPSQSLDIVIAANVFAAPAKEQIARKLPVFLQIMRDCIKRGGKLIVEENYDAANIAIADYLSTAIANYGFKPVIYTDKSYFVHKATYVKGAYSLYATRE